MSIEYADQLRSKGASRKVTIGGETRFSGRGPKEIARELRAKSELGRRERRLEEAEAKLGNRD